MVHWKSHFVTIPVESQSLLAVEFTPSYKNLDVTHTIKLSARTSHNRHQRHGVGCIGYSLNVVILLMQGGSKD
jgi:hypothetical protein